jgi:hypothetical protein
LGERCVRIAEVGGSNPPISTNKEIRLLAGLSFIGYPLQPELFAVTRLEADVAALESWRFHAQAEGTFTLRLTLGDRLESGRVVGNPLRVIETMGEGEITYNLPAPVLPVMLQAELLQGQQQIWESVLALQMK